VPATFYDLVVWHMVDGSGVLAAGATRLNSESGKPLKVPKSTAFSTSAIVSENTTIPTSDPTLGTVTLGAFKYGSVPRCPTNSPRTPRSTCWRSSLSRQGRQSGSGGVRTQSPAPVRVSLEASRSTPRKERASRTRR
jgi:hypothetical protein